MSQQILVISPEHEVKQRLCDDLRASGHIVADITTLVKPSDRDDKPAVCIVDLRFSRQEPTLWTAWLQDCHSTQTGCLAFDTTMQPDRDKVASLEPLSDILTDTGDQKALCGKVHTLLTIRKLLRQLHATRHQLTRYQEELQDALDSAAHIQRSLIPTRQPSYGNLHYSWRYMPCKQVGGDLFNIVQLDEQTIMTYLVDVSGHGISSAMVTVSVHQSLSLHTGQLVKRSTEQPPYYAITAPRNVLNELETEYPFERFEEFFTISYLLINPHTGHIRYSNGGHPPPLLLRSDGSVEQLDAGGTVIGVGKLIDFEEGRNRLTPGDRLFMYTDGITDHTNPAGAHYGEDRFLEQLQKQQHKSLDKATRDVLIAMREFGGSTLPVDDVTLIGMEFK
jgi:sigma-B regulation protein RsbU (phosphoserine phosphatase)